MNTHYTVAKAVLFDEKNNILLLKRSDGDNRRPGEWDLPGGSVEEGEELTSAVAREVFEETGIQKDKSDFSLVYATCGMRENENIIQLCFSGRLGHDMQVELSSEHTAFIWADVKEAAHLLAGNRWGNALQYLIDNDLIYSAL